MVFAGVASTIGKIGCGEGQEQNGRLSSRWWAARQEQRTCEPDSMLNLRLVRGVTGL